MNLPERKHSAQTKGISFVIDRISNTLKVQINWLVFWQVPSF